MHDQGRKLFWNMLHHIAAITILPVAKDRIQPVYCPSVKQLLACREFQQTITVGGRTETAYGTACRQPDGDWKIVS